MRKIKYFIFGIIAFFLIGQTSPEYLYRDLDLSDYNIIDIDTLSVNSSSHIEDGDLEIQVSAYTNTFSTGIDLNSHQGYTTDGTNHYLIDTDTIFKLDATWSWADTNSDPFSGLVGYDHLGDGDYYNGYLYIPAEQYYDCDSFSNQSIIVFNASDLSRISVNDISAQGHEVAGLTVVPEDGTNGIIYIVSYCDSSKIWKYNLSDFSYLGNIELEPFIMNMQGIAHKNGLFFINANISYSNIYEHMTYRVQKDGDGAGIVYTPFWGTSGMWEGLDYSQDELRCLWDGGTTEKVYYLEPNNYMVNSYTGLGRSGIGTPYPLADFHITYTDTGDVNMRIESDANHESQINLRSNDSETRLFYRDSDERFGIYHKGVTRFAIKTTGDILLTYPDVDDNVGVGVASPAYKLDIGGIGKDRSVFIFALGYHLGADSIVLENGDTIAVPTTAMTFCDTSGGDTLKCYLNSSWEILN